MRETYGLSNPRRSDTSTRGGSQATAAGRASECKYTAAIEKEVQASCGLGLTRWRDASASSVGIGSGPRRQQHRHRGQLSLINQAIPAGKKVPWADALTACSEAQGRDQSRSRREQTCRKPKLKMQCVKTPGAQSGICQQLPHSLKKGEHKTKGESERARRGGGVCRLGEAEC